MTFYRLQCLTGHLFPRRVSKGLVLDHAASSGGVGLSIQIPRDPIPYCPMLPPAARRHTQMRKTVPILSTTCLHLVMGTQNTAEVGSSGGAAREPADSSSRRDEDASVSEVVKIPRLITLNPRGGLLWAVSQEKIF